MAEIIEGEVAEPVSIVDNRGKKEDAGDDVILLGIGNKAVLTLAEEQAIVQDRIKEHEAAIAKEELLVFECQVLGKDEEQRQHELVIANSYRLVNAYVEAYNRRYGGNENG